jgi:nucleotide-binding universal stress UspA family protein
MKTTLVALDGSPRAEKVLSTAIGLAYTEGSRLSLVRVIGITGEIPKDLWRETDKPLLTVLDTRANDYLERCREMVPPDLRGAVHVVIDSPWEGICKTAKQLDADLIVIGSHGYSGIDRLIGTTAAKVVNHSPCSVLVVKSAPRPEAKL